ncbi:MAG: thioredoxin domain-containing protein [Candidatus Nomurabacteria bacterium]|nr:thioredoxin domain-containing protein [Candidatus Nomurabacteria bacterium]
MENNEHIETKHHRREKIELTTPAAIIVAGMLIGGSILMGFYWLTGGSSNLDNPSKTKTENIADNKVVKNDSKDTPTPVTASDHYLGNQNAPLTLVLYADYQCPFCGKFFKDVETTINNSYVKNGSLAIVYRDFSFLGSESIKAAEAARCSGDQNKYWQYHDYLFSHQKGENQGQFSADNLKSFAKDMGLDTTTFNKCLDSDKYAKAVIDSTQEGGNAGVQGTPKGFIMKAGKVVETIDGAEPLDMVTGKLDKALK